MSIRSFFVRVTSQPKSWLRSVFLRRHLEAEMEAELAAHLENLTADLIQSGLSPAEAARQARIAMGAVVTHKENMRASLGLRWWDEFWADLRYGLRILRKNSGFTAIAVSSLALAIGANTMIFSIAKQALYDKLNVPHPEQLRILGWTGDDKVGIHSMWADFNAQDDGMRNGSFSYPVFRALQQNQHSFDAIFGYEQVEVNTTIHGVARRAYVEMVSGNYYDAMLVQPQLGRPIVAADDAQPGAGAVAVISDGLWQREYGRSPSVLGQTIKVNDAFITIIGVNPRGFTGAKSVEQSPEIFVPLSMQPLIDPFNQTSASLLANNETWWLDVSGRLKPGVTDATAQADLEIAFAAAVHDTLHMNADETAPHIKLANGSRGLHALDFFKEPIYLLIAMTALVVLLACVNIANLMLARGTQRQQEMSIRIAVGAGRGRVLRQMMTESFLLAALGGVCGVALGFMTRNLLPALMMTPMMHVEMNVPFDWRVCGFATIITLLAGLLFGMAPAWRAARVDVNSGLKESAKSATRRRKGYSAKALVSAQVALSMLLIAGAGLFLRTVLALDSVDPGFRTDGLVLASIEPPVTRYAGAKGIQLEQQLEASIAALPGVEQEAMIAWPYLAGGISMTSVLPEGATGAKKDISEDFNIVGNNIFSTLGIPILAGRSFGPQDTPTSVKVALVNRSLARILAPDGNVVGKRVKVNDDKGDWLQIVGVCGDTRYQSLRDETAPQIFLPYLQSKDAYQATFIIRTRQSPTELSAPLRRLVQQLDPDLPIISIQTQKQMIRANMPIEHTLAILTAGFGVLALVLACVGIYGIMAYSVANRTNEIGIRLALGAQPAQLRRMILRESTWLAVFGIMVGLAASLALGRLVKSMLFGIQPYDPLTLSIGVLLLLAVALAASWLPARRAAGVQPMEALRHE